MWLQLPGFQNNDTHFFFFFTCRSHIDVDSMQQDNHLSSQFDIIFFFLWIVELISDYCHSIGFCKRSSKFMVLFVCALLVVILYFVLSFVDQRRHNFVSKTKLFCWDHIFSYLISTVHSYLFDSLALKERDIDVIRELVERQRRSKLLCIYIYERECWCICAYSWPSDDMKENSFIMVFVHVKIVCECVTIGWIQQISLTLISHTRTQTHTIFWMITLWMSIMTKKFCLFVVQINWEK